MNGKILSKWCALVLTFGFMATARAQHFAVDWHTIAGGGGTSSNAVYEVTGTIGQSATAHAEGGSFGIDSGFWGFAAAVQMPGAPWLTIRSSSAGAITILWPSPATGFFLQSATDLATKNWVTIDTTPTDDGNTRTLVLPVTSGNRFFRLIKSTPGP